MIITTAQTLDIYCICCWQREQRGGLQFLIYITSLIHWSVGSDDDMQQMWVFALKWLVHFQKSWSRSLILHRQMHMFTISAGIKAYRKTLELERCWNTASGSNDSACLHPSIFCKPPLTPDRGQSLSRQNTGRTCRRSITNPLTTSWLC